MSPLAGKENKAPGGNGGSGKKRKALEPAGEEGEEEKQQEQRESDLKQQVKELQEKVKEGRRQTRQLREQVSANQQEVERYKQKLRDAKGKALEEATDRLYEERERKDQRQLTRLTNALPDACRIIQRFSAGEWTKSADGQLLVTVAGKQVIRIITMLGLMDSGGELSEDGEALARLGKDKLLTGNEAQNQLEKWAMLFRESTVSTLADARRLALSPAANMNA